MKDALLDPDDLARIRIPRRLRGYDPGEIDYLLERLQASYAEVTLERDKLRERIEAVERELDEGRALRERVSDALVDAERAAEEVRTEAQREAAATLAKATEEAEQTRTRAEEQADQTRTRAEEEAEATLARAAAERSQVENEVERLRMVESEMHAGYRAFLLSALQLLDGVQADATGEPDREGILERSRSQR
jgi:cell division initiation protein